MSTIASWPALAGHALAWLRERDVSARDAIVLVPAAAMLPPARRAFAAAGGWQPRVETPHTLTASLGVQATAGGPSFDTVIDRLAAAALLRRTAWGSAAAQRDPRAFERGAAAVAATAQALAEASFLAAPAQRDAWWQSARDALAPVGGPGASERLLARIALEWAATCDPPATDALQKLAPGAWIGVHTAGTGASIDAVLAQARVPMLKIDVPAPPAHAPARRVCTGFEAEARAAAAAVLQAITSGQVPVLLVAEDRLLVRRTRALLERAGARMADETGWKLSTTRAAARVMALLRAAAPNAGRDAALDHLKAEPTPPAALLEIEARWRRPRRDGAPLSAAAATLLERTAERLRPLATAGRMSLADWADRLRAAWPAHAGDASLAADDAGRQVLAALRLDAAPQPAGWDTIARDTRFDLDGFTAWVDDTLESATYLPPADDAADVVVTPLARVPLRPFAAAVFAGTDAARFGAPAAPHPLLPDALLRTLGLDDARARRDRTAQAFAHLLALPNVTLLRRASDEGEALAPSPLVESAALAAARGGQPWPPEQPDVPPQIPVAAAPVPRPLPSAGTRLPERLSASAVEALRACPYRFYARSVLALSEPVELEAELDKRDYGTWLHAVLHRFHESRMPGVPATDDLDRLQAAADAVQIDQSLDAAELLPYRAGFATLAPLYVAWLRQREARGWAYVQGEVERTVAPGALDGAVLRGIVDRIDRGRDGVQLLDYKTGSAETLKARVRDPLEDTQLPFYAALVGETPVSAAYLVLHDRKGPMEIPHPDVADSADRLVAGLSHDLARLRAGAPLRALGEGDLCDTCEARGLCRRDHWSPA